MTCRRRFLKSQSLLKTPHISSAFFPHSPYIKAFLRFPQERVLPNAARLLVRANLITKNREYSVLFLRLTGLVSIITGAESRWRGWRPRWKHSHNPYENKKQCKNGATVACMYSLKLKFPFRSWCSRRRSSAETKAVLVYEMLGRHGKDLWRILEQRNACWLVLSPVNSTGVHNSKHFKVWWSDSGLPGRLFPMRGSPVC